MNLLSNYKKNIFSQFGEDGIIEKIFEIIEPTSKVCVEFGAWDGVWLSNTANLWKNKNWKAVLIENNYEKFKEISINSKFCDVIPVHSTVGTDNNLNSIDFILNNININSVDLLSIDIDGNEYYILENLICKPSVIIVEYNPTIPYWIDCYQKENEYFGASVAALERIAKEKKYSLVSSTETNLFFVNNKYYHLFEAFNTNKEQILDKKHYEFIISDYSGKYLSIGNLPYGKNYHLDKNKIIFKSLENT